ncbi:hypothetical protein K1719_004622 [Acacia pycnantha]|nr:hypothetical protein K1719_004622 [Acacia pycnantha]
MSLITMTVFLRTEMKNGHLEDGGKFLGALFFSLINMMFNGMAELAMTIMRLPMFFKQRDLLFYPAWAFALPIWVLRIPISFMESALWTILTYYTIGFAPPASRTQVVANTLGTFTLLIVFVLGGFIICRDDRGPWSMPNNDTRISEPTVGIGKALLKSRGLFTQDSWFWISIGALLSFSLLFNILFIMALTYLNPLGNSKSMMLEEEEEEDNNASINSSSSKEQKLQQKPPNLKYCKNQEGNGTCCHSNLSLAFSHVNYYINMPPEMKKQGIEETRLQLLRDTSGAFRPGVLTALVGVSDAGKTTLMDVLAGRKTGGYIEGSVTISGYPKNQSTFARISGYCEQNDIHSPNVTVYESLAFSAWLRLMFIEEVMELVELQPIRNFLVGLPGIEGLSTEQRKRLTIAVELVANRSIIFMDEPTSGVDSRASAIVMRTVRNTVDTGRTVVCTIHQPSIDIFEAFDELLLMKRGGQIIYGGPLGQHSQNLIEYFEAIPGVPKIREGYNPATWMLEISTPAVESQLGVDFAELYTKSELYHKNEELIKELSTPVPRTKDLYFPTKYSQSFITQCKAAIFLGAINTSTVQPVVAIERTVFYRERAAGMYSELPYAISQVPIEIIHVAIQTLAYSAILYSMIGLCLLHFVWHDDCSSHTKRPSCCDCYVILPQFLEPLLWISHPKNANTNMVEVVLLGIPVAWTLYGFLDFQKR